MGKMRCWILCSIVLAFSVIEVVVSNCGCRVPFKAIGCRKDTNLNRALPELLINERDRTSKAYNGYDVDWFNWDQYLPAFTCRCANAAMKKGYKYFSLQFWGECWSGPTSIVSNTYENHGKGEDCYGPGYKKCDSNSNNCVGDSYHNYAYEIVIYECPVKFERLGCYKDSNRPLPEYVLTDRNPGIKVSSGISIDWKNFDTYVPDLSCRCAQKAVEKGYNTFGVQYYGECWTGEVADENYYKNGVSKSCINGCYKPCTNYDSFCAGKQHTNFVYRLTSDVCEIQNQEVGCYAENTKKRAFDELIVDDVHPQSSQFMGIISTDFDNWGKYIEGLICRCARKIKEKGYETFAIFNGGECWSGANAHNSYKKYGESKECYYNGTTPCTSGNECAGGNSANFVYELSLNEFKNNV